MNILCMRTFLRPAQSFRLLSSTHVLSAYFAGPQILHKPTRKLSSSTVLFSDSSVLSSIGSLPDPPLAPVHGDILNALGEPTLSSLGLCSYWPSGWYQAALETLHVSFELPWWAAIVATTVIIRLSLFPLMISQRRKLAKYTSSVPQLTMLQDRMTSARLSGNYVEMLKVSKEMQEFMRTNDVNPLKSMKLIFIQFPIFLSVFTGLRGMSSLPVESMETGGLSWFTNLTVPDPYYLLPLISMATTLLVLEAGTDMSTKHLTPIMKMVLRASPCVGLFFVINMPSSVLLYWTVSNFISLIQTCVLRIPVIRDWLKLPHSDVPAEAVKKTRGFAEGLRESFTNVRLLSELETRERLDANKWQQAARAAAPRTFAHNPRGPSTINTTISSTNTSSDHSVKKRVSSSG